MSRLQCLNKGRPVPDARSVSLMTLRFLVNESWLNSMNRLQCLDKGRPVPDARAPLVSRYWDTYALYMYSDAEDDPSGASPPFSPARACMVFRINTLIEALFTPSSFSPSYLQTPHTNLSSQTTTMQFRVSSLFTLFFALLSAFSLVSATPLTPEDRVVFAPHVTYPHTGTVWKVGQRHNVTWFVHFLPNNALSDTDPITKGTSRAPRGISRTRLARFSCATAT